MAAKVVWTGNLEGNLARFNARAHTRLVALMTYTAPRMEARAKERAPWTDRTGNARRGLTAVAAHSGNTYSIILFHRVPYGIWLEIRWSGKYQIIMPTIQWGLHELEKGFEAVFAP